MDLDPDCAAVVRELPDVPVWSSLSVASARRLEAELFAGSGTPEMAAIREFAIEGPAGDDLPLRAYRPVGDPPGDDEPDTAISNRPTVVFCHGGGWTLGTLDSADDVCRALADRTGALVLSVGYRLAPEHPFPAAVDDAYRATRWAAANAGSLGGGGPLAVAGTSAGGGLAAATALRAGGPDGPDIAAQALLYPMLDRPGADPPESYAEHGDAPLLTAADVEWFWAQYCRSPVDAHNPFAAPLRADDDLLADAPPAVVATAGVDPRRDEGRAYADRLADAPVERVHGSDLPHGFCSLTDRVSAADAAMDRVCEALASWLR